ADRSVGRAGRSAKAASGTEKGGDRPPPRFPRKRRGGSVVGDLHRLWFGGTKGSNPLCSAESLQTICSSAPRRSWPRRSVTTALGSLAKEPTCLPAGRRCGSRPAARARSFCADPHGIGIIDLDSVGLRPVARQMPALPTIVLAVVAEEISAVPIGNPQSAAAVAPDSPCALPRHGRVRDRGDAGLAEMLPLVAACRSWRRQGSDRLCLLG